jgi:2-C-methyl-D-erythritol 4-phosphate cytidylyltransferase/2-C-methyl-D-erythritol 2,4-cyclodiphosphate synthase
MKTYAIIPAAGQGRRMGASTPKQYLELHGTPILIWTLQALMAHPSLAGVVLVVPAGDEILVQSMLQKHKVPGHIQVVAGGATRRDSVAAGLAVLPGDCDIVLVHDGARPLITPEVIDRVVQAARMGAVTAALPMQETVKEVDGGVVTRTVDRSRLWSVQTPQGFPHALLCKAHALPDDGEATDDCSLVERLGETVGVVMGTPENIKITTPADLALAERWLTPASPAYPGMGIGYDVHRLGPNRLLVLGGVEIPYELGLLGHSDADVLTHACIDALLGAAGLGDIGQHFPDSDARYAGISSLALLGHVIAKLEERHLCVGGIDAVIMADKPRLAEHIPLMRTRLAEVLGVTTACVNIKATTSEGLGFVGRQEGIAAQAVAWVKNVAAPTAGPPLP